MRLRICFCLSMWIAIPFANAARPGYALADGLQSDVAAVRAQAAKSLGREGDSSAVPQLIVALGDASADVRREAAKSLGFLKDDRAVEPLISVLADSDKNVRHYAAYALGEMKDGRAAQALLAALGDPEWCVRDQAAWALREIGDPAIVPSLAKAMAAKEADLKQLVWILQGIPDVDVVAPLAELLEDDDVTTRLRAVQVLGTMREKPAVDALIAALSDSSPKVRHAVVDTLVAIGDRRVKKPLEELASRETDAALRAVLEAALVQMSYRKDLAAHWSFDDGNTALARDVTDNDNDGQIIRCTTVAGRTGTALKFGEGTYVELGKPSGLPIGNAPFTVMAWIKSDAPRGVVVARGGAFCGYSLYVMDGVAKFGIHRVQDGPTYIAAGKDNVVGRWVHLAGVVRQNRIELYVNGKPAAAAETPGYIPGNCGQGMEIGYDVSNSPAEIIDHFQGVIDEVKCYGAALAAEDIADEFALPH
jgi:HEAT repeat protein